MLSKQNKKNAFSLALTQQVEKNKIDTLSEWNDYMSYKTFLMEKELGYSVNELNGLQWIERLNMFDRYAESLPKPKKYKK